MSRPLRTGTALALFALFAVVALLAPAAAPARPPFQLGLTDPLFLAPAPAERALWLDRAADAGARSVLLSASWTGIAPSERSSSFDPSDPADPAYDFAALDAAVRDARARGLAPLLLATGAPSWAEGANRPADSAKAPPGSWKPRPRQLQLFGTALAERYSGDFDGGAGAGTLPRVRDFQLWAEPNLATYLTPQFRGERPVAARHYRKMLRAFYAGVHSASGRNRVITGGTAPYGDIPHNSARRTQPALFWREVLCLEGRRLKKRSCKRPAKFDVLAHHPINVGGPLRKARNQDDVSTPDIGKLRRILRTAQRTGRALPRRPAKPIWATELWWDTRPPDPHGVPEQRHARWMAQSFHLLWRQRVERVIWFPIRDQPATGSFASTVQSGLYTHGGEPKLARRAFAFPFVAERRRRKAKLWGVAPNRGRVLIESRRRGGWKRVGALRARGASRVFTGRLAVGRGAKLRAVQDGERSLPYRAG
jgi:hypothetical protein